MADTIDTIDILYTAYNKNEVFKEYVDKHCEREGCSLMKALRDNVVFQYWVSLQPGGVNYKGDKHE